MTDTFTGTLQVLGTDAKTFTVSYGLTTSDASVSVTALTTVANGTALSTTIGVAFGSIAFDGSCQRSSAYTATAAKLGQELVATGAFIAGTYCVQLFDSGTLTEPTTYSVTVKHY